MPQANSLISIVLPTYNEVGNIVALIKQIQCYLGNHQYEIIIVDDDSPDGTAQEVIKNFKGSKNVRLFVKKDDKGLAQAIRFGIEKSNGHYILVMDTDFNHDPKVIPSMLKLKDEYDLIVGSRYVEGGGMENNLRYVLSLIYNSVIRLILRLETHDNLSGFFFIKRSKLSQFDYDEIFFGYGEYFIRLLYFAKKNHFMICEIPVFYKNRISGQSKSNFFSMLIDYSKTVFNILSGK